MSLHTYYIFRRRGSFVECLTEIVAKSNDDALTEYNKRTRKSVASLYSVRKGALLLPSEDLAIYADLT